MLIIEREATKKLKIDKATDKSDKQILVLFIFIFFNNTKIGI